MPIKLCEQCGAEYSKTGHMSKKIWEAKKYCGNACASMAFWDAKKGRKGRIALVEEVVRLEERVEQLEIGILKI